MLFLTRRQGQSLTICPQPNLDPGIPVAQLFADGPIRVQVVLVRGPEVCLGLSAHPGLCILREELLPVPVNGSLPEGPRRVLARRLKALMFLRRHSPASLAAVAGLPLDRVTAAESGAGTLDIDDIEKLAQALGESVAELFRPTGRTPEERWVLALLDGER